MTQVFRVCRPACHDSSLYLFVLVLFFEAEVLSQVHVAWDIFYQHIVHVYSSCSICCSSCGVSVHTNMSSAKRRLERNSPSIFTPLFSQFTLLNMLSNVAVNSLGEMVSPCLTPLVILIFSLSLCRCTVTKLSVFICLSRFLCTHLLFLALAIISMLLGFVLSRMASGNPRKQHTVVCCIHGTSL